MKRDGKFIKIMTVFLTLALLLTFFSKTIYNFNLPAVTVVMPAGGILVDKVEKDSLVKYSNAANIYAEISGKVKNVLIAEGQEVKKGQALLEFYPDTEAIDNLVLSIQKKERDIELLSAKLITVQSEPETDLTFNKLDYQTESAKRKLERLENEISGLEAEISALRDGGAPSLKTSEYEHNIKIAEDELRNNQILYEAGVISRSGLAEAENKLTGLKTQYEQYIQSAIDGKAENIKTKRGQTDVLLDTLADIGQERIRLEQEKAKLDRERELSAANKVYEMADIRFQINNAQAEHAILEKQLARAQNVQVVSDMDGVVTAINAENNKPFNKNEILVGLAGVSDAFQIEVIADEDEMGIIAAANTVSVKVKGIQKALPGEIVSSSVYQNEGETKQRLIVRISNSKEKLAYRNAAVTFTAESEKYDTILPNSAVRQDGKGYYVLTLKEEDNIFGKNYLARRVYIDVIDSDNSLSAISGLVFLDPVIETSTAPVSHGSRVKYEKQ